MNTKSYENLKGKVERVLYHNSSSKWGVLSITNPLEDDPYFKDSTLILTGNFDGVFVGCEVEVNGKYTTHPRYGAQIAIDSLVVHTDVVNKESVINFLSKSLIKGIDVRNAKKIWDKFKDQSIEVVLKSPEKLLSISGIGSRTFEKIKESVGDYLRMEKLIKFCNSLGIPYSIIYKLDQALGDSALEIIQENIYAVLDISDTLSFTQIDAIAMRMGIDQKDPRRLEACMSYSLSNRVILNSSTGCMSSDLKDDFYKRVGFVDLECYNKTINTLKEAGVVITEGAKVFLSSYYNKEKFIARMLSSLKQTPVDTSKIPQSTIDEAIGEFPFELNAQQKEAVNGVVRSRISVLTGGPGSGKSTITKAVVNIFKRSGVPVVCLSPTGKATRRMEECTNHPAYTIHKFLGCKGDLESVKVPIVPADTALIIDESSMLDISMLAKLLEIAKTTPIRLILVGDKDQLPSVMAGNILSDLLVSGSVDVFKLTDIMRQAKDSHIIQFCADVNNGNTLVNCGYSDFVFKEFVDDNTLLDELTDTYLKEVQQHGLMEVQVIAPYKKGTLGTMNLNKTLADWYNTNPLNEDFGYREGDKVMQISNDYNKEVFNGEVGICTEFNLLGDMRVQFQTGDTKEYGTIDLSSLMLAYAATCHKSQGAEYQVVFVVLDDTSGGFLLTRKLLYTAMSRGKKKVYVLAKQGCASKCVRNVYESPRITKLREFMKEEFPVIQYSQEKVKFTEPPKPVEEPTKDELFEDFDDPFDDSFDEIPF